MTKRIVIDGAAGSGKTTFLLGHGHEDVSEATQISLQSLGYSVLSESIRRISEQMRKEGIDLLTNIEETLKRITKEEIRRYGYVRKELIFLDRGLPGYAPFARYFGTNPGDIFEQICKTLKYSAVFIFEPINFGDKRFRSRNGFAGYTWQERLARHRETVLEYQRLGYNVTEVPVFSKDVRENFLRRKEMILKPITHNS